MNVGSSAEHFVIHWLLLRGLDVGGPYNQQGPHDMFVKLLGSWYTVQVKVSHLNRKTGVISRSPMRRGLIISDLVALVDLSSRQIRWESGTPATLPKELL